MGRELLEGTVLDRNANFMASHLTEAGFRVRTIQVLDDEHQEETVGVIKHALELAPSIICMTGGMGPGNDDMTRQCVAAASGRKLVVDETAREFLAESYRRLVARGIAKDADLNEHRMKMATVPEGSICYENPIGTAPGIQLEVGTTTFVLMPGQPEEMRGMFETIVQPVMVEKGPQGHRLSIQIDYPGGDESVISRMLADIMRRHHGLQSRARLAGAADSEARMRITMIAEGTDKAEVQGRLDAAAADLRARLGLEVAGTQPNDLSAE